MATISERLKHAWDAFAQRNDQVFVNTGPVTYGGRPDRPRLAFGNERSIISSIYTRIAIDVAGIDIRHVRTDDADRYLEDMVSGLQDCLQTEPNMDQGPRQFRQDIVMTLFDKGVCAVVPVETTLNPLTSGGWDVKQLRVGWVVSWMPQHVRVSVYNEERGLREEVTLPKNMVAIIENPLYTVMNEPNSTLQRLISKLNLLDAVDEQSASGKLDLIIQLPYVVKSESRRQQAEQRRKDIEFQLKGSKYGIAYTDGTEKITQLNRPAENNLMGQIEFLTTLLYGQLGITDAVMNGTADEKIMLNYWNRTVEPLLDAITEGMRRAFLTKTARTQGQDIMYFRDPFKLVPIADIAEIADKFTRNEITSSNEIRQAIGMKPSQDPKADQLVNSNMPVGDTGATDPNAPPNDPNADPAVADLNSSLDNIDSQLNAALGAG